MEFQEAGRSGRRERAGRLPLDRSDAVTAEDQLDQVAGMMPGDETLDPDVVQSNADDLVKWRATLGQQERTAAAEACQAGG